MEIPALFLSSAAWTRGTWLA